MADVSVEFGAKDTGLEKTLKAVQAEMEQLTSDVKSGELSFGELQQTMRKLGQASKLEKELQGMATGITATGDASSAAAPKVEAVGGGFLKMSGAVAAGQAALNVATAAIKAGFAALKGTVDDFGRAIDLGGRLNDLASRTGETAGNLLVLERAFDNSGVGADKVGSSINKLQKVMVDAGQEGSNQAGILSNLGVSMSDLAGKTPTEQMQELATRIAGISDPAQRAQVAMQVFGKEGGKLLPLLNNFSGELTEAQRQLGSLPGVMDRSNAAFDAVGDQLAAIRSKTIEFAAGFIERALPALNVFTNALAGIDAAGWGQKLMDQIMRVADFLIGAFKAPMPAIAAIGSALEAGIKIAGNNFINSMITAGRFLSGFFSSDLPGIIAGVVGNTLIKAFIDSAKAFIDAIRQVIEAFETWMGSAIANVVDFFTTKFSSVLRAVAEDFKAAMSDPIGFVSGKLDSALKGVMEGGGNTFQTSFDKAGGSVLDKLSTGLGAVSDQYGDKIVAGATRAKDEFGKLVAAIEPSARDFFGAEEAANRAKENFKGVEATGKKLREDFESSAPSSQSAKTELSAAAIEAQNISGSFDKSKDAAKAIKEEMSTSAKLMEAIAKGRAQQDIDRGGRLEKRAQEQLQRGSFGAAQRTAERLQQKELEASIRGAGEARDRRSMADIGREAGLSMRPGETGTEFTKRIAEAKGIDSLKQPGEQGRTGREMKGKEAAQSPLEKLVAEIKELVKKIEPKLPMQALA
jgi:hypothetical protein